MTNTQTRYRLKPGTLFAGTVTDMIGVIRDERTHEGNGRQMFRLQFERQDHQKLWEDAWFYLDDMEEVIR